MFISVKCVVLYLLLTTQRLSEMWIIFFLNPPDLIFGHTKLVALPCQLNYIFGDSAYYETNKTSNLYIKYSLMHFISSLACDNDFLTLIVLSFILILKSLSLTLPGPICFLLVWMCAFLHLISFKFVFVHLSALFCLCSCMLVPLLCPNTSFYRSAGSPVLYPTCCCVDLEVF